jgi:hypothetical protein
MWFGVCQSFEVETRSAGRMDCSEEHELSWNFRQQAVTVARSLPCAFVIGVWVNSAEARLSAFAEVEAWMRYV